MMQNILDCRVSSRFNSVTELIINIAMADAAAGANEYGE